MNKNNRMKPREIKPSVKRFIFQEAMRQRKVPRELLANRLIKEIEESGEIAPKPEVAKRYISKSRNSDSPLDDTWTLGVCKQYPALFPPGSESILMKYKYSYRLEDLTTHQLSWDNISIRVAIWIIRLQPIILKKFQPSNFEDESTIVLNIAHAYSSAEYYSELMGDEYFNSSDLDDAVYHSNLEHIFLFSGGFKFKGNCKDDCDSCKYVPLKDGYFCELKIRHKERLRQMEQMVKEGLIDSIEEGD